MGEQLKLFDDSQPYRFHRDPQWSWETTTLQTWQTRIHRYQQRQIQPSAPHQLSLWETSTFPGSHPDHINPFTLPVHSSLFWRQSQGRDRDVGDDSGCLYFIVDRRWPLLLYVGETQQKVDRRWQGTHDCKDYILHYIELHRRWQLPVEVVAAFWPHLPPDKKLLQTWEKYLIHKWRSPFNKECWQWWGQPFGKPVG